METTNATAGRRYKVLEAVGRGGFGTVYKAALLGPGGFRKTVALKVLNPEIAEKEDLAARLRDEARMLGLLKHRAIVHVDGLQRLADRWALVMEFVEGVDLKHLLTRTGPMPVGPALEVMEAGRGRAPKGVQDVASILQCLELRGASALAAPPRVRRVRGSGVGIVELAWYGVVVQNATTGHARRGANLRPVKKLATQCKEKVEVTMIADIKTVPSE